MQGPPRESSGGSTPSSLATVRSNHTPLPSPSHCSVTCGPPLLLRICRLAPALLVYTAEGLSGPLPVTKPDTGGQSCAELGGVEDRRPPQRVVACRIHLCPREQRPVFWLSPSWASRLCRSQGVDELVPYMQEHSRNLTLGKRGRKPLCPRTSPFSASPRASAALTDGMLRALPAVTTLCSA